MASPFHAVTTLSSRNGRGRSARAAASRSRTDAIRPASTGIPVSGSCSTEAPSSKVAASGAPGTP